MRFTVVGEVGALSESGPVPLSGRLRLLLAGLLAHRNGEVSRNDLIAIIWGEQSEPADAEATLRQYVSRLRRAFREAEVGAADLIATTPSGYRLEVAVGQVDADELGAMLVDGRRPAGFDTQFGGAPYGSYQDEWWCRSEADRLIDLISEIRALPVALADENPLDQTGSPVEGRSLSVVLPRPANRLIGRQQLVSRVSQLISQHGLVTLTATGGSGKTRLAIAVAETEIAHREDGVFFADLTPLSTGQEVASLVANVVGVQVSAATPLEELARFLAPRQMLVVLDNCEHLIDSCAELASAILAAEGQVRILATSRERLGVDGEHVIEVPTLAIDDVDSPAVQLFAERATAVNPEVDLDCTVELVTLCRRLDGLPLAIELAAARTVVLSVPELLVGLEDRFRLLSPGRRRHGQALEATIDWSYRLLDDAEQRVFRALGAFVGTFDLQAVANVAELSRPDAIDLIEALILKSMVHRSSIGVGRFRLLESLKAYAETQLATWGETAQVQAAHVNHFAHIIGRPPHYYFYSINFRTERGDDRPNIVASAAWAAGTERWVDTAWLLKAAVGLADLPSAASTLLPAVDECERHLDDSRLAHEVRHLKTNCYLDAGDYTAAMEHSRGMALVPDRFTAYMATVHLANLLVHRQPDEALRIVDDVVASRPDDPIDDHEINSTTLRVAALAQLEEFEACDQEIARYFAIEDAWQVRQGSGISVVVTAAVLAWLRDDESLIYDPELINRYARRDGSLPLWTAVAADFIRVLDAVAGRSDDAQQRVERYTAAVRRARINLEYNSALVLLSLLAFSEEDHQRAAELLKSVGPTAPPAIVLVARELAKRVGRSPFSAAALTANEATAVIVAEAERRGWQHSR